MNDTVIVDLTGYAFNTVMNTWLKKTIHLPFYRVLNCEFFGPKKKKRETSCGWIRSMFWTVLTLQFDSNMKNCCVMNQTLYEFKKMSYTLFDMRLLSIRLM